MEFFRNLFGIGKKQNSETNFKNDTDLMCASCGRVYILGKTGQAMTSKVALSMMSTVLGSGGGGGLNDLDGIYPVNEADWNDKMRKSNEDALREIYNSFINGQHRRWKCRSCGHEQDYHKEFISGKFITRNHDIKSNTLNDDFKAVIRKYRDSISKMRIEKVVLLSKIPSEVTRINELLSSILPYENTPPVIEYKTKLLTVMCEKYDMSADQFMLFLDAYFYRLKRDAPEFYADFIKYANDGDNNQLQLHTMSIFVDFASLVMKIKKTS